MEIKQEELRVLLNAYFKEANVELIIDDNPEAFGWRIRVFVDETTYFTVVFDQEEDQTIEYLTNVIFEKIQEATRS